MNKLYGYIKSALYNIKKNKAYAIFVIFGAALTFIFITIILQMTNDLVNNTKPFSNADKTIMIGSSFKDNKGNIILGISKVDTEIIRKKLDNSALLAYANRQFTNILINDKVLSSQITFVGGDYWEINNYNFIKGRSFSRGEITNKERVIIITDNISKTFFGNRESIGKKISFFGNDYKIIGIIDDFPSFAAYSNDQIWCPADLNNYVMSGNKSQEIIILPNKGIDLNQFRKKIQAILTDYYKNRGIDIEITRDELNTLKEYRIAKINNGFLKYGLYIILLLLLLIPALNIIIISVANTNNRAVEIAIRRSVGATIFNSFTMIIIETLLLVIIGAIIGIVLSPFVANYIGNHFLSVNSFVQTTLMTNISTNIQFFIILPLILIFTLIAGGIPGYFIANKAISIVLKGGSKC